VHEHDYDGLDLDWEALQAAQRERFSLFVEELARLLHEDGRVLSVTVYPKLSEPGGWDAPRAQDWRRLAAAADRLTIMTYNYSGSWSGPGPLSPPAWMDRVLDFAATVVPPEKTVVGIGFYGREWAGTSTTDLVWADVERLRTEETPRESRPASRELRLVYRRDGIRRESFFPDAVAVAAKLDMLLAEHPQVRGICCWLMGQEDPQAWQAIAARLRD